jgi:hypothetical protein
MSAYDLAADVEVIAERAMTGSTFTLHPDGVCLTEPLVPEHLPCADGYIAYPPGWRPSQWLRPTLQPADAWLSESVLRRLVRWDHGGRYWLAWVYDAEDWNTTLGWVLLREGS